MLLPLVFNQEDTMYSKGRYNKIIMAALQVLVVIAIIIPAITSPTPAKAIWCGRLPSYTTWYNRKPILFVWKGKGSQNPTYVSVWFNNYSVPNADNGVITSSPQVDLNDGWVGYYISTRWYLTHHLWDDDWMWEVRGCIP